MEAYIHKVKYYECDKMGVTHHSNYIRFMEEARIDYLDKVGYGYEKMEEEGIVSPVIAVKAEYKKTTTFQDEISVELSVVAMSNIKFSFGYVMKCRGAVVFKGESSHCFLVGGRPVSMEEKYPELYRMLQEMMTQRG